MNYTSLTINMRKKTISDTFSLATTTMPVIGDTVAFNVLGQSFSFIIDDVRKNKVTNLYDVSGSYDIADMLNRDVDGQASPAINFTDNAKNIATKTISKLGKSSSFYFDDFTPTGLKARDSNSNCVCDETFQSLLQKLFGWTDIIPTTLVNVYQRGGVVYVVQRGHETGTIEISDNVGNPSIEQTKMNLIYDSHKTYYLKGEANDYTSDNSVDGTDPGALISGSFVEGENTLVYSYGLLRTETYASTDGTKTGTTTYDYGAKFYPPANLVTKNMSREEIPITEIPEITSANIPYRVVTGIVNVSTLTNTFAMNGTDLAKVVEVVTATTSGYNITTVEGAQTAFADEVETSTTETTYVDMGQGLWSVTVYKDNKFVSSQTVTGNPGAKATPYAIKQNSTYAGGRIAAKANIKQVELSGKFSGNLSLNISDLSTLERVASAIESLNGKTEERVILEYYGDTFCDYINKIKWRGKIYYLESNSIVFLPIRKQKLELVRWF